MGADAHALARHQADAGGDEVRLHEVRGREGPALEMLAFALPLPTLALSKTRFLSVVVWGMLAMVLLVGTGKQ